MTKAATNSIRQAWNGSVQSQLPHWRCNLPIGTPASIRKQRFAAADGKFAGKGIGGPMADTNNAGRRRRTNPTLLQEAMKSKEVVKDEGHSAEDGVFIQDDRA